MNQPPTAQTARPDPVTNQHVAAILNERVGQQTTTFNKLRDNLLNSYSTP